MPAGRAREPPSHSHALQSMRERRRREAWRRAGPGQGTPCTCCSLPRVIWRSARHAELRAPLFKTAEPWVRSHFTSDHPNMWKVSALLCSAAIRRRNAAPSSTPVQLGTRRGRGRRAEAFRRSSHLAPHPPGP